MTSSWLTARGPAMGCPNHLAATGRRAWKRKSWYASFERRARGGSLREVSTCDSPCGQTFGQGLGITMQPTIDKPKETITKVCFDPHRRVPARLRIAYFKLAVLYMQTLTAVVRTTWQDSEVTHISPCGTCICAKRQSDSRYVPLSQNRREEISCVIYLLSGQTFGQTKTRR